MAFSIVTISRIRTLDSVFSQGLSLVFLAPLLSFWINQGLAQGGYTLDFNGTDEYVDVPYDAALNPGSNFSVECWVKIEGGSGNFRSLLSSRQAYLLNDTRGYTLYAGDDNQWQFWIGSSGNSWIDLNSNVAVTSDWTHIAGTYDGSTLRIYVNGVLANSMAGTYTANPEQSLLIGVGGGDDFLGGLDYYLDGKVDEVRVWSDERTADEIRANMHKELVGNEANLTGYYQMSDGTGTTLTDNSSNSNAGSFTNTPEWKTSGALAGSGMLLDFDGLDDQITFAQGVIDITSAFTVELWMYARDISLAPDNWSRRMVALDGTHELDFAVKTSGAISYLISNGAVTEQTQEIIDTDEWYHVALVYDGADYSIYINGESTTLSSGGLGTSHGGTGSSIGSNPTGAASFDGQLDEIRIWSDARTQSEIRANKDRALDGDEANLVVYYRLDQQSNLLHTTAYDYSGNGNNGMLINMDPVNDWVAATTFNTWIGSEDSDWGNAANWSSGTVPSTEDVGVYRWVASNDPSSGNISGRNVYTGAGVSSSHSGNLTLSGNLNNEGTFTTTGLVTFSGSSAQRITGSGTTTIGSLTLNNAAGLSLEQDVTVSSGLTLTNGALSIGSNTLTLEGSISISTGSLTGGASSNITFAGSGASTALPAISLNNLTLNRANGISLGGNVTVEGQLSFSNGSLTLNSQTLTLGDAATVSGANSARRIIATSGNLRKEFSSDASFLYPVGDATYYSPITLDFTATGYASAYAEVNLTSSKHPNNPSSSHYISRYWTVESSGITGFSCNVTAVYDDNDITGTESQLFGGKWDGASWTTLPAVSTGSNELTGTVSSFSDFTAGEETALPVEWLGFEALVQGMSIELRWETASELNSDYFAVERKDAQTDWQEMGRVQAVGHSTRVQTYDFTDTYSKNGTVLYRLRQVDFDGSFNYSEVRSVYVDPHVQLYPNPVHTRLHLELPQGQWSAKLLDLKGREVLTQANLGTELDLQFLAAGNYQLILNNDQGVSLTRRITKR